MVKKDDPGAPALSPEQEAQLDVIRDEWIAVGLSDLPNSTL